MRLSFRICVFYDCFLRVVARRKLSYSTSNNTSKSFTLEIFAIPFLYLQKFRTDCEFVDFHMER